MKKVMIYLLNEVPDDAAEEVDLFSEWARWRSTILQFLKKNFILKVSSAMLMKSNYFARFMNSLKNNRNLVNKHFLCD